MSIRSSTRSGNYRKEHQMKTYQLAIREIAAAHEKLGEPMKKEEQQLLEQMNTFQLAQELNLAREVLNLRQTQGTLEISREMAEHERRRMEKQEQEGKNESYYKRYRH
nr:MAG TPA: hypothetical protein [Caudoviricetes sp.]